MLTDKQIRDYFEQGYLLVENVITDAQLKTLQNITYDFIEASKNVTESNDIYDLDVGHTCLLYTSPSPRDLSTSRMPSSA